MRSPLAKPLHELCGRPMVLLMLDALAGLCLSETVVVVGAGAEDVTSVVSSGAPPGMRVSFAFQSERRGTGDAAAVGLAELGEDARQGDVLVIPGDMPLLGESTLSRLVSKHRLEGAAATVVVAQVSDPAGYGRVLVGPDGSVRAIVESSDASEEELSVSLVNTSAYCLRGPDLSSVLQRLEPDNAKGEYYLTDAVSLLAEDGLRCALVEVGEPSEALGVNDPAQLSRAQSVLRQRINERWAAEGVRFEDLAGTYVDWQVRLEPGAHLLAPTVLSGSTVVGGGARVGPNCEIVDSVVGEGAEVTFTSANGANIGRNAVVGPFAFLGRGASVAEGARTGPFFSAGDLAGPGPSRTSPT